MLEKSKARETLDSIRDTKNENKEKDQYEKEKSLQGRQYLQFEDGRDIKSGNWIHRITPESKRGRNI